ncbi:hypothetical protein BJ742DRAFT_790717 [Cladochytrium replicatum]|nr:hypothetical protein BJ742DRAFT_790717 [Cladochytrium replicatum]
MANSTGSARKDVLQFLEELDQLTVPEVKSTSPSQQTKQITTKAAGSKTTSSAVADDVLSFLDEIAGTASANAGGVVSAPQSQPESKPTPQSTSPHSTKPELPSAAGLFTPQSPTKAAAPISPTTNPPVETYTYFTQSNPSVPQAVSPTPNEGAWGWDKLWTTATAATAKVSAVTSASLTKGLETVRHVAEETGKAVAASSSSAAESAVVKKLMADVSANREKIGKFGSEITTLTKGLVDTIAPPITERTSHDGYPDMGPRCIFSGPLTVWICAETLYGEDLDTLHDFVQAVANEWWLSPPSAGLKNEVGLCTKVVVNSVKDPAPKTAASYAEAMTTAEHIVERLQKLHAMNSTPEQQTDPPAEAHSGKDHPVFIVVQPFLQDLKTPWEVQSHLQYLVFVVHPLPNDTTDAVSGHIVVLSQSIAYQPAAAEATAPGTAQESASPEDAPPATRPGVVAMLSGVFESVAGNIGRRRGAARFAGGFAEWNEGQRTRVLECAVADACEEFAAKCYQAAKEKQSLNDAEKVREEN